MTKQSIVSFVDRVGSFYTKQYGFAPVVGRTLGYLSVCSPAQQSIDELAAALQASRTAISNAVKLLEQYHLVERKRPIGSRVDLVEFSSRGIEQNGLDADPYYEQAVLAREGLQFPNLSKAQRAALTEIADFADFLAKRVPALLEEWHQSNKRRNIR